MLLEAEININAPPRIVREIFLDFPNLSTWHDNSFFINIAVTTPEKTMGTELVPGDKASVKFPFGENPALITAQSPDHFSWLGSLPYIFTGEHHFYFKPPPSGNPNQTVFTQSEKFTGLLSPVMYFMGGKTEIGWKTVNEQLKAAAEAAWAKEQGRK